MRWIGKASVVLVGIAVAGPALAQGYGVNRAPAPPRHPSVESPGYEGRYDRDDKGWRAERHDCLYGAKESRSAARSCDYIRRNPEPLSSDYLKTPKAK